MVGNAYKAYINGDIISYIGSQSIVSNFQNDSISFLSFPYCTTVDFVKCKKLISISLPICTYVNKCAFQDCISLESINLPNCSNIKESTFNGCIKLSEAILPKCVTLEIDAFKNCEKLSAVYLLNSSVCTYPFFYGPFDSTPIEDSSYLGYFGSIYVPSSLVSNYKAANGWSSLANRITAYIP